MNVLARKVAYRITGEFIVGDTVRRKHRNGMGMIGVITEIECGYLTIHITKGSTRPWEKRKGLYQSGFVYKAPQFDFELA